MTTPSHPHRTLIHLLDGGLGTTLADQYSVTFDDSTPLWSSQLLLTSPPTLLSAQTAFANAGADIILTATYQASFEGFARSGVGQRDAEVAMRSGVLIARRAFGNGEGGRRGMVALSLGAYGATMLPSQEYSGMYDEDHVTRRALGEWHAKRIGVFLPGQDGIGEGGCWEDVDYVAFETLPRIDEVGAARDVMASLGEEHGGALQRSFWISCVFPGEGNLLPDGSTVQEVVSAMLRKSSGGEVPMGIGINCTKIGKLEGLILEFEDSVNQLIKEKEVDEWPSLVVYPDGTNGEVYNTTTKEWEIKDTSAGNELSWDEAIYEIIRGAVERGLWKSIFVGGCCKTTPEDIGKLRTRIDGLGASSAR